MYTQQIMDVISAIEKDMNIKLTPLCVDGGMASNNMLIQTQSDLLGVKVCMCMRVYVYVCECVYVCVCVYVCMYIYIYIYIYKHACM
jgi:hypothetical protein